MPWIFLCLILANAAFFGWQISRDPSPKIEVAAQPIPEGKRLQLLSERPELVKAAQVAAAEKEKAEEEAAAMPVASGPQCFSVGPFAASPATFVGKMQARQFVTRVDVLKKDNADYWVFVPALLNRGKAEEKLKELKRQGIESFIVNEEPFANAISLGHFSKKELAEGFRAKMVTAGVAAEMRNMPQKGEERWVYVAPGNSHADIKSSIDGAIGGSGAHREPTPCQG